MRLQQRVLLKRLCKIFVTFFSFYTCGSATNNFPSIEFPPRVEVDAVSPSFPTGHLDPLGHQRPPDGPVKEYVEVLRPESFWEEHVSKGIPLVFRQGIGQSPALSLWTDDYLRENYGDLDVLIELKEENRTHSARRMSIKEFLSRYKQEDVYIVSVLPDPMRREVQVPQCLLCGTFRDYIHETNFWMSSGGTRSVIHYDADHNLHCLIVGRKDFIMIEKEQYENLYFNEKGGEVETVTSAIEDYCNIQNNKEGKFSGSGYSEIDPNKINLHNYPNVAKVPWTYATVLPGDCIYIPSGHIHQVRSYNRTISATMLFTAGRTVGGSFEPKGCEKQNFTYTTLGDVEVHWTYKKGDEVIEMGYMNIEVLRDSILSTLDATSSDVLTEELFVGFWDGVVDGRDDDEDRTGDPRKVFRNYLDAEGKGYLTRQDIVNISKESLKNTARIIDPPHGPIARKDDSSMDAPLHEEL